MPHAFISFVRDDAEQVDRFVEALRKHDVELWLDREEIDPGTYWPQAMRRAIEEGNFFIACFSKAYSARQKSTMTEELNIAIGELRLRPDHVAFFISVKLDPCDIPDMEIRPGKTLRHLHYVELYKDWDKGIEQVARVILETSKKK